MIALIAGLSPWGASPRAAAPPDFAELAAAVGPSVVNIGTSTQRPQGLPGMRLPDLPQGSPLYEFFERFFDDDAGGPAPGHNSLGSGFIVSRDGYVVSNYHVLKDADDITVRLTDQREFPARLIGTDPRSDLALLKIDASGLPAVRFADPDSVQVGDWVVAIGSPFGLDYSVTAGIVSAKGRSLPNENYVPFIQTDVAINPGSSGGPLFNLRGEVVGVNSQIFSRTGGYMGLSFAIPVDLVATVTAQLLDGGVVRRGWLGVLIQDVTSELAQSFGMPSPRGALVSKIVPDGPAANAGLRAGDVIVTFNGTPVDSSAALPPLVGATPIGSEVILEVVRAGKTRRLTVHIGELPSSDAAATPASTAPANSAEQQLGLIARDPAPKGRERTAADPAGVVVVEVEAGPARDAGIRRGDLITLVDNEKIRDLAHFRAILARLPAGKSIPVLVQREGSPLFLALKMRANP